MSITDGLQSRQAARKSTGNRLRRTAQGESPADWKRVSRTIGAPVQAGVLDDIPAQHFAGAPVWTLRLVVQHASGKRREARHVVRLG